MIVLQELKYLSSSIYQNLHYSTKNKAWLHDRMTVCNQAIMHQRK